MPERFILTLWMCVFCMCVSVCVCVRTQLLDHFRVTLSVLVQFSLQLGVLLPQLLQLLQQSSPLLLHTRTHTHTQQNASDLGADSASEPRWSRIRSTCPECVRGGECMRAEAPTVSCRPILAFSPACWRVSLRVLASECYSKNETEE